MIQKKHGEKQGVGVGVGGDEFGFLSFVCVGKYENLFNVNFFFQTTVEFLFKRMLLPQDRKRVEQP